MRPGLRRVGMGAIAIGTASALAACGSSGGGGGGGTPAGGGDVGYHVYSTNSGGTPVRGGVLNLLGTGDVDYMDPNLSYYTVGYAGIRLWSRQLYTYPAIIGKTTTIAPDLATGMPKLSADGKTATITIRQGAKWDTSPPRQITAADVVRGIEIDCNPGTPFGGISDYEDLIVGYRSFCDGFAKVSATPAAIKSYLGSHQVTGLSAKGETLTVRMTHPATYLPDVLGMPATSPRPVEELKYVPGTAQDQQNQIADGPYKIASYVPTKSIDFVRNPAWDPATDPIRKAYVDEIKVDETGNQDSNNQQLLANQPTADLSWDLGPNPIKANQLIDAKSPNINVQSEIATNPYIVYNVSSPNNNKALANVKVRQAISYALDRQHLIQDSGGTRLAVPLTHVLPQQLPGGDLPTANMEFYPYNPSKAKAMLKAAGASNLHLIFMYRPAEDVSKKMFQTVQQDLSQVGIKVTGLGVPEADFFTKYLFDPNKAKTGVWDLSLASWGPDWYGSGAGLTFFKPLFDGRNLPPASSNYGLYADKTVETCIDTATAAKTESESAQDWANCDAAVMKNPAIYPIENPNTALIRPNQVHNAVYLPDFQNFDFSNVWLSKDEQGG